MLLPARHNPSRPGAQRSQPAGLPGQRTGPQRSPALRPGHAGARVRAAGRWLALALALAVLRPGPGAAGTDGSLYAALGGLPVITAVARTAGGLFRADPRIAAYFDNINADWLRPRLIAFVCHVSGGPCVYPGRSMAASHKGLHVDAAGFAAFMEDFQVAMQKTGVAPEAQARLMALLTPMGRDIVTR